jgi:hypothetical protein
VTLKEVVNLPTGTLPSEHGINVICGSAEVGGLNLDKDNGKTKSTKGGETLAVNCGSACSSQ